MVNYKVLISVIMIFSSCTCADEELNLQRMDFTGNELRTDGYYFSEQNSGVDLAYQNYFLYKNGVILYGFSPKVSEIPIIEERYMNGDFYEMVRNAKHNWGVFRILGNEIEWEKWEPGPTPLETFVKSGVILNNETFHLTNAFRPDGSDEVEIDELYHFKAFSPKPDSTNMFIP